MQLPDVQRGTCTSPRSVSLANSGSATSCIDIIARSRLQVLNRQLPHNTTSTRATRAVLEVYRTSQMMNVLISTVVASQVRPCDHRCRIAVLPQPAIWLPRSSWYLFLRALLYRTMKPSHVLLLSALVVAIMNTSGLCQCLLESVTPVFSPGHPTGIFLHLHQSMG